MIDDIKNIETDTITFVPLGVSAHNGKTERSYIQFSYDITDNDAEELTMQIRDGARIIYEERITDKQKLEKGENRIWKWYGFDKDGILDTAKLTNYTDLNLYITGHDANMEYSNKRVNFKLQYDKVKWVDVRIDKCSKRIDLTLRVNLIDGGENGTEKDCKYSGGIYTELKRNCPWDDIPKIQDNNGNDIDYIKIRSRTYEELKSMVLDGINTYWSRRHTNTVGTIINNTRWEVIVTAVNTNDSKVSLNDIPLIYNTNNPWYRSGNTGGSYNDWNLDDEVMGLLPNGIVQRISFNSGYIYHSKWKEWYNGHPIHQTKGWVFNPDSKEEEDFKETAAHEIGHEILQAYHSTIYSWQHKGSSYYFPQDTKPLKESFKDKISHIDFMDSSGESIRNTGEIDLMKYYNGYSDYKNRIVASEEDLKGLLWLTKLYLK